MVKQIVAYQTSDGAIYKNCSDAEQRDREIEFLKYVEENGSEIWHLENSEGGLLIDWLRNHYQAVFNLLGIKENRRKLS
jgi:hypothetical protein